MHQTKHPFPPKFQFDKQLWTVNVADYLGIINVMKMVEKEMQRKAGAWRVTGIQL